MSAGGPTVHHRAGVVRVRRAAAGVGHPGAAGRLCFFDGTLLSLGYSAARISLLKQFSL
jgi:hypothetical protein